MGVKMKKILFVYTLFLYIAAFLTVLVSAHVANQESLLETMTKENGFFEWMSFFILMAIAVYGLGFCKKHRIQLSKAALLLIAGFAVVAFLGAMEEISWGQKVLHFQSSEYFIEHNYQKETNLHNFIPAELFSSIIYSSIYAFFVFIPLIVAMLSSKVQLFKKILPWLPVPAMTLMVLYASSFQAFFYDDFGAWFDMGTLFAGMVLFGIVALIRGEDIQTWGHYAFVWLTIGLFMMSYEVFGFFNMQYEIREVFTGLAIFYYYIYLTQTYVSKRTASN